jgi:hypothetical protein
MIYVPYPIELKETGVTITTMKLKIQFAEVDNAFAGARIRSGTCISAVRLISNSTPQ